jgi:hypothetical protein
MKQRRWGIYKLQGSGAFTFHSPHLYLTGPEGEALFVNDMSLPSPFLLHSLTIPSPTQCLAVPPHEANTRCKAKTVKNKKDEEEAKEDTGRSSSAENICKWCDGETQRNYYSHRLNISKNTMLQHLGIHCMKKSLESLRWSRNSPPFMGPEGSLPCSQQPTNGLCPESDECSPRPPTLFPSNVLE